MEMRNTTMVTDFILVGFTGGPGLQISLFIFVLLTYIVTLGGNVTMIVMICIDQSLHTPMYFLLWNLSLLETLNISNIVPLILVQTLSLKTSVSTSFCFVQSFFYFYLATNVLFILPIMSCDRFVAICNPLRYTIIINSRLCFQLVVIAWLGSLLCILSPIVQVTRLPFCGPNIINHYFCDGFSIMKLACIDTNYLQFVNLIAALIFLLSSFCVTVVSYIFIISTVLRIKSANGRQKAFSTCSSHLTMVAIVYGSAIFTEVSPALNPSVEVYKSVSLASSLISPLMNPFIYTLRNKKAKEVLKRRFLRAKP